MKHSDEPEKFMESELELHAEINELYAIAASPELYPTFVEAGSVNSVLGKGFSNFLTCMYCVVLYLIRTLFGNRRRRNFHFGYTNAFIITLPSVPSMLSIIFPPLHFSFLSFLPSFLPSSPSFLSFLSFIPFTSFLSFLPLLHPIYFLPLLPLLSFLSFIPFTSFLSFLPLLPSSHLLPSSPSFLSFLSFIPFTSFNSFNVFTTNKSIFLF